jgi:exodeoxyribonuclease VII large subunit
MAQTTYSLYEINQLVKKTLKNDLGAPFWIVAEIMEFHLNRSGHCYLELIEKTEEEENIKAKAQGTIWAHQFRMLKPFFETTTGINLGSGLKILFKATIEFHELYGFSLNITDIDPTYTLGDLAQKKREVIRRLTEEGVFHMNREIGIPAVMQKIAVISSNTAAGYGDFIDTLQNNSYAYQFETVLFPALLQGDQAVPSIINAFDDIFERESEFECLVLIRGGGSQSDLECFNHYDIAYHITQFPLPVLTGIGHERDESVSDMVAAQQLKTPTAVAEFLIDRLLSFEMQINGLAEQLQTSVNYIVRDKLLRLNQLGTNLVNHCRHLIKSESDKVNYAEKEFAKEVRSSLRREQERIDGFHKIIELIHPDRILARGYSITKLDGKIIKTAEKILKGQKLETILHNGIILSSVEEFIEEKTSK